MGVGPSHPEKTYQHCERKHGAEYFFSRDGNNHAAQGATGNQPVQAEEQSAG
nr:G217 [uncultured bacterium]